VQEVFRDLRRAVFEQRAPVAAQKLLDAGDGRALALEFGSHVQIPPDENVCNLPLKFSE
jgi:hypothetical protein